MIPRAVILDEERLSSCLLGLAGAEAALRDARELLASLRADEVAHARGRCDARSPEPASRAPAWPEGGGAGDERPHHARRDCASTWDGPCGPGGLGAGLAGADAPALRAAGRALDEASSERRGLGPGFKANDQVVLGGAPQGQSRSTTLPHRVVGPEGQAVFWVRPCRSAPRLPVLHPNAPLLLVWILVGIASMTYEAAAIPAYIAFDIQPEGFWYVMTSMLNTYFLADVLVCFFTAYTSRESGEVVLEIRLLKIGAKYIRSWFILDVVSSIPWEWLPLSNSGSQAELQFTRSAKILRLVRLVPRMVKLRHMMAKLEMFVEGLETFGLVVGIVKTLFALFFVAHWCSCLWHEVGRNDSLGQGHNPGWTTSLVEVYGDDFEEKSHRYTWALYFVVTTMTTVGYGDISPNNLREARFALFLLPVASVGFAMMMGTLTDIIGSMNAKKRAFSEKKQQLIHYMRWRQIPEHQAMRVRQYMLYLWDTKQDFGKYEEELKGSLPTSLREELCFHLYGKILQSLPFLWFLRKYPPCMNELASMAHVRHLEQGDYLFRRYQRNEDIFVVLGGAVWVTLNCRMCDDRVEEKPSKGPPEAGEGGIRPGSRKASSTSGANQRRTLLASFQVPQYGRSVKRLSMTSSRNLSGASKSQIVTPTMLEPGFGNESVNPMLFQDGPLKTAGVKLFLDDLRLQRMVRIVQRRWRAKKDKQDSWKSGPGTTPTARLRDAPNGMRSHLVRAPAYFGEACLWQPFADWDGEEAPPHTYTTRCETRVELLTLERGAVRTVIDRFSPWMEERFEFFRMAVISSMERLIEEDEIERGAISMPNSGSVPDLGKSLFGTAQPSEPPHEPPMLHEKPAIPMFPGSVPDTVPC